MASQTGTAQQQIKDPWQSQHTEEREYAATDRAWALKAIHESAASGGADIIALPELGLSCPSVKGKLSWCRSAAHCRRIR